MAQKLDDRILAALELAKIGFYCYLFDGTIVSIDQVTFDFFELEGIFKDPQSLIGRKIGSLFNYTGTKGRLRAKIREKGRVVGFEYGLKTLKGKEKWGIQNSYLLIDEETGKEAVQVCFYDITDRKLSEEALQESEAKYRTMMESMQAAVYICSSDFCIEYMNPAMIKRVGRDAAGEVCHKAIYDLEDRCPWCVHEKIQQGESVRTEIVSPKDHRYYDVSHSPMYHQDGSISKMTISRDITERKQAENALKESEKQYRLLVNNLPGFVYKGLKDWSVEFFDNKVELFTGYPMDQFNSKSVKWIDLIVTEDIEPAKQIFLRALKADKSYVREYRLKTKTEDIIWIQERGHIVCNELGEIECVNGVFYDITHLKTAEDELRKSRALLHSTIESLPFDFFAIGEDGRYIMQNSASKDRWGDIIGKRPEDLSSNVAQLDSWLRANRRAFCGETIKGEMEYVLKGEKEIFHSFVAPIFSDGEILGILGANIDITERKKMEIHLQNAQKMEAIGTLAGGIAHDFNNILSAVIGYTEIALTDVKEDASMYYNLQQVLKAGERAKDLVQQILTFSRQTDQEMKPIQVQAVVKEVLKLLRATLPSTIEIKQDVQSKSAVLADPTRIHQVLMNICANSGHAMQEKGGLLEITLNDVELDADFSANHPDIKPGPFLKLSISDTGHGMSPEILKRIFDPFYTTKEKGEGTGMGLAVVHGIVKSHGGTITVYSEPEKGAVFNIYLPVIERGLVPEVVAEERLSTGTERILFVDDEQTIVDMGRRTFESLGYEVVTRTNSVEALELFKAQTDRFDLVITDMTMPKMTGEILAKELMKIRPDLPVILCTGFNIKIDEKKAMAMGIRAFVSKPVLKREIAKVIRTVLDG